jgi:hypothetical protein
MKQQKKRPVSTPASRIEYDVLSIFGRLLIIVYILALAYWALRGIIGLP